MINVESVCGMCAGFSAIVIGAGPSIRTLCAGTSSGHKTIWQQTQDGYGRLKDDKQYDAVFDLHAGKTTGLPGVRKWERFAQINPTLDIRDVCNSEWNHGYYRKVSVEEMLSNAR